MYLALSYITQCTIQPRTSDSTYAYMYRHGIENKSTLLHCYVASVLNTNLLFSYTLQVLTRCQLQTNSSSVSHLTAPTYFISHGSNNDQWVGEFWNLTSMCRWLENSATCRSTEWSNATNNAIHLTGKFAPAGSPMHYKCDVMLITFHCLLLGKVHCSTKL